MASIGKWHASVEEAKAAPVPEGRRSARIMQHGSMSVLWYAPKGVDEQMPHDQDEVYVVMSGHGTFKRNDERVRFGPGDVLFAGAGEEHRFEEFSDDFATWVIFYGPIGGE